ncbi:MAG: hypothetical protein QOJ21_849 [Solirubrobacteraceae bacterium]|jgi:predicted Na+-dependent transporter|nr:hypothetical protein [Solirubrobacteraceae bacterium]
MRRLADRLAAAVLPLTLAAAAAALVLPSRAVAERSELLLAALVLLTAMSIEPRRLQTLRERPAAVIALSAAPLLVLVPLAWAVGQLFGAGPVRDGALALGLAPTEVAAVGLVALAGADAVLALAAVAGSLVVSAVAGPVLLSTLAEGGQVDAGPLVGSFALVVLLPLAAGLTARAAVPALGRREPEWAAGAALVIAALAYAALSGAGGGGGLGEAALAAGAFLLVSAALAAVAARIAGDLVPAFCLGMRDFAVAAALATQAFGPRAGTVAGVYGVMMLVAGAALAAAERRGGVGRRLGRREESATAAGAGG